MAKLGQYTRDSILSEEGILEGRLTQGCGCAIGDAKILVSKLDNRFFPGFQSTPSQHDPFRHPFHHRRKFFFNLLFPKMPS